MDDSKSERSRRFALVGAAGYIAPAHMRAIKEIGSELVAAIDPSDSVGVIDSYFPDADFFVEFERYDRHLDKLHRSGRSVDYVSICSPNHLHDAHVRHALHNGADAVCEKPLVINPWNLDALLEAEAATGRRIYNILQLRLHPAVRALKDEMSAAGDAVHDIDVTYVTGRGRWYFTSWKSREAESGGIAMNIGVHLFDMLSWIFGPPHTCVVHLKHSDCAAGYLEYQGARVRWFLSVNMEHLPAERRGNGKRTHRVVLIDDREWEFSDGFNDLHTESYRHILSGKGFGVEDARLSIETVHRIRTSAQSPLCNDYHPYCRLVRDR